MSYINFSLTHRLADPASTVRTLDAGFSREGGRPEFVRSTTTSAGILPPMRREASLEDPATAAGASALLSAIQAAGWVQDIVVTDPIVRETPAVSWTMRDGSHHAADLMTMPEPIRAVYDAARALQTVVSAA